MADSRLFHPIRVGTLDLQHRKVLAPLTRNRADDSMCATDAHRLYYEQRASPGGLLITEATHISPEAVGYNNVLVSGTSTKSSPGAR